ncbi:MAG: hypothetical protein HN352_12735 [Bacteroidetes bacterium]|jgi:hypothetical protein|nr:hypothetical protein [Bacteroidota bacterium]MBT4401213.1 hypothetical protein [Bacteroidota bacterium]MBT7463629.1 hypothetical protein [Bacteroidota bacterium]
MRDNFPTKFILLCVLTTALLLSGSCKRCDDIEVIYPFGLFPDTVINLEQVNTEYDDYNSSAPPSINYRMALMFSSNRNTQGGKYSLIDYEVMLSFDQHAGTFGLYASLGMYPFFYLTDLANSADNEFGPNTSKIGTEEYLTMFSSDRTGNMEIFVSYWTDRTFNGMSPLDPAPFRLQGVNSAKYDGYPTLSADHSEFYLCSNRDDNLDIYKIDIPEPDNLATWISLKDTIFPAEPVEILNSPAEDACPYINGALLVFASKREGGYGGYDLYYSRLEDETWGEPINFGPDINTEYNEFRPIVMYAELFENDLMIFSSDRPSGKGGYDLYYTGIPRMSIID